MLDSRRSSKLRMPRTMSSVTVKWLHAPAHVNGVNKAVIDYAREIDPVVIDWSEMYWDVDQLEKHGHGYRHVIGKPGRTDSRRRTVNHDVVISVRKDAQIIHEESFYISRELTSNVKYMPERHGKAVVFVYQGIRVLILAWHPQPKPLKRASLVLSSYANGVRRVQRKQRSLERRFQPDLVLNGGDLQQAPGTHKVSPNRFAQRNKMQFRRRHIDWQMWKGAGFELVRFRAVDPSKVNPKMDHVWTILTLKKEQRNG